MKKFYFYHDIYNTSFYVFGKKVFHLHHDFERKRIEWV